LCHATERMVPVEYLLKGFNWIFGTG
jgi:hypothetical protein